MGVGMKAESAVLSQIETIARRAGAAIMAVYNSAGELAVRYKDDDSPLTEADRRANAVIAEALEKLAPRLPVLSEESARPDWETRRRWRCYWLVDPLDGTKEFVKRNGEFTVNIARVNDGVAELGVVHVPVSGVSYLGEMGQGAFRREAGAAAVPIEPRPIVRLGAKAAKPLKVVASRSHLDSHLRPVVERLESEFGAVELVNLGSSLKFCLIAEGGADVYPRLAPTSEWDTAAAHAVLAAAGGEVCDTRFKPLRYNRKDGLLNPNFVAMGDRNQDWRAILAPVLSGA